MIQILDATFRLYTRHFGRGMAGKGVEEALGSEIKGS